MSRLPEKPPKVRSLAEAQTLINELWIKLQDFETQVKQNSGNSSKPPSSDGPADRSQPKKTGSDKKRGAQKGHKGHRRALVAENQVNHILSYFPPTECACGGAVIADSAPQYRHQIFDVPVSPFTVTEYQLYGGVCTRCEAPHKARLPDTVSPTQMGSQLLSLISVWSGQYHLSIRQIQSLLNDQYGLSFSVGAISQAQGQVSPMLTCTHQGIKVAVQHAAIIHADETRHQRTNERRWMWIATSHDAACFMTHYSRAQYAAKRLLGDSPTGIIVTDQYAGYNWLPDQQRQLCWAHILRNITAMAEHEGYTGFIGKQLLLICQLIFRTRHRYEQGQLCQAVYQFRMQRLRRRFRSNLENGRVIPNSRYQGRCQYLLKDEAMCWTFLADDQIPLTNNEAERRIRGYVLWRKGSYGVWSHRGELFRQRILSHVETCKKQNLNPLSTLRDLVHAVMTRQPYPDVFNTGLLIPAR